MSDVQDQDKSEPVGLDDSTSQLFERAEALGVEIDREEARRWIEEDGRGRGGEPEPPPPICCRQARYVGRCVGGRPSGARIRDARPPIKVAERVNALQGASERSPTTRHSAQVPNDPTSSVRLHQDASHGRA